MEAKLIRKLITQKVAAVMDEKTKQYEKKIKKLEKVGKDGVSGESSKNGTRGGGRASKKKKKLTTTTTTTTKYKPQQQSASRLAQGRKSILQNPLRGQNHKSGDSDSSTLGNRRGRKAAQSKSASRLTKWTSKTNGAKLRGCSKIR